MTRPVFALYASRPEAEAARARLVAAVEVEWTRMLAKDTAAAVGDLKLDQKQAKAYHEALQRGDYLLIAKVARGEDPKRITRALADPVEGAAPAVEPQQSYSIEDPQASPPQSPAAGAPIVEPPPSAAAASEPTKQPQPVASSEKLAEPGAPKDEPEPPEQLRVGEPQVIYGRSGGRAGSEPIANLAASDAAPARRISYEEVEALGLLKDRTIEVVEMREEPVVAKEVVVREEVIVRKTVSERTETIRDTLRRTQVEVDDLSGSGADR